MVTKKLIQQTNSKINKLKRVGYKPTPETIVMRLTDEKGKHTDVTYRQFKRILKRL